METQNWYSERSIQKSKGANSWLRVSVGGLKMHFSKIISDNLTISKIGQMYGWYMELSSGISMHCWLKLSGPLYKCPNLAPGNLNVTKAQGHTLCFSPKMRRKRLNCSQGAEPLNFGALQLLRKSVDILKFVVFRT